MQPTPHKIPILTTFEAPPGPDDRARGGPCLGDHGSIAKHRRHRMRRMPADLGGEIAALTTLATDSRNQAMDRLEAHAIQQGANAVLAMRFDSGELMQNTNEIVAYGTAVNLRAKQR